mmetsp:Transcript_26972/g.62524  ORF Transcript_26972/g.62524 Transcript_26972/m.62524 type:complete len:219 (-) Transcript_26972:491-1147(-)
MILLLLWCGMLSVALVPLPWMSRLPKKNHPEAPTRTQLPSFLTTFEVMCRMSCPSPGAKPSSISVCTDSRRDCAWRLDGSTFRAMSSNDKGSLSGLPRDVTKYHPLKRIVSLKVRCISLPSFHCTAFSIRYFSSGTPSSVSPNSSMPGSLMSSPLVPSLSWRGTKRNELDRHNGCGMLGWPSLGIVFKLAITRNHSPISAITPWNAGFDKPAVRGVDV